MNEGPQENSKRKMPRTKEPQSGKRRGKQREAQPEQAEVRVEPPPRKDPFAGVPVVGICLTVLLILLVLSRFVNLDYQGFHHDESIHCKHSWDIVNSSRGPASYRYDPVYHGPFLYHFGALYHYFAQPEKEPARQGAQSDAFYHHLLPDSDSVARMPYATVGLLLVAVFLLWGRRFGWGTCLLLMGLLTLSPILDYFSRFARNDVYQTAWLAGTIATGTLYLQTRRIRYLTVASLFLALSYCTKENSYVNNFSLCSFLILWGLWRVVRYRWEALKEIFVDIIPLTRLLILYGCFSVFVFSYVAIDCRVGPETGLVRGIWNIATHSTSIKEKADANAFKDESGKDLSGYFSASGREEVKQRYFKIAFGTTLALLILVESASFWLVRMQTPAPVVLHRLALILSAFLFYPFLGYRLRLLAEWVRAAKPESFLWSLAGKLSWEALLLIAAAAVFIFVDLVIRLVFKKRAIQEGPNTSLGSIVMAWKDRILGLWGLAIQILIAAWVYVLLFSSLGTNIQRGTAAGFYNYLSYWFRHQTGDYRIWGAWWYYVPRLFLYELLPIVLIVLVGAMFRTEWLKRAASRSAETGGAKKGTGSTAAVLAVAAESASGQDTTIWKPIPSPLLCFSGYLMVYMLGIYAVLNEKVPWLLTYQAFSISLFAALLASHWLATHPHVPGPFVGRIMDLVQPSSDVGRLAFARRWAVTGLVVFLIVFQFGQHLTTVFFRPDQPTELLVYTGTTHAFAEQVRKIRRRMKEAEKEGKKLRIAVYGEAGQAGAKAEWPSAWYFRNDDVAWKRLDLTRDIQILDDSPDNRRQMKPRKGNIWEMEPCWLRGWWIWHGTPKALPGELEWSDNLWAFFMNQRNDCLRYFPPDQKPDPREYTFGFRNQILNYAFFRKTWYPLGGENILVCYKTDELVPPEESEGYLEGSELPAAPLPAQASFGTRGSGPGQFDQPRGLAITPDGNLAVADSKNGRIQILSPDGKFLSEFGRGILSPEVSGVGSVVCNREGEFYVADTWNHAVRKFSTDGKLLANTIEAMQGSGRTRMFGPRGIAVNSRGEVFVTDTGNRYVRVFDRDLQPLFSWGGVGGGPGQFNEPVGIAIDDKDRVYVADTGNGRIQRFSAKGEFEAQYLTLDPLAQNVIQVEPYLAVLSGGRLAVTFSTAASLWIVDTETMKARIRRISQPNLQSPVGVVADGEGNLWVGCKASSSIVRLKMQ
jgi:predicted membrane-bound mannosyltransferase/streptogramin lyase